MISGRRRSGPGSSRILGYFRTTTSHSSGGLTRIIRNHPKERFGTKAPLAGSFDDPSPEIMTTVMNVFKNAFIKAFEGKLSNDNIDLPKVDPEKK